jgi:hypothetical protein
MRIRLPFGYTVEVRLVGRRWLLASQYGKRGGWSDFEFSGGRLGKAYICKDDPLDEQFDTLTHELYHAITDWTGMVRRLQRRVQREMRDTATQIAAEEGITQSDVGGKP